VPEALISPLAVILPANITEDVIAEEDIDVVEEWILKGAYCSQANFGEMDWATDTPVEISLTIRMDYAILNY